MGRTLVRVPTPPVPLRAPAGLGLAALKLADRDNDIGWPLTKISGSTSQFLNSVEREMAHLQAQTKSAKSFSGIHSQFLDISMPSSGSLNLVLTLFSSKHVSRAVFTPLVAAGEPEPGAHERCQLT